jgi:hypothetical protein
MGYYLAPPPFGIVEGLPGLGKADALLQREGVTEIEWPREWVPNLVCVVDNGEWDAAAYAYDEAEMQRFIRGHGGRPMRWLIVPDAGKLSGHER